MKFEANLFSNNQHRTYFEQPASHDTKFHRAAIDGYVDMLCDASKRDTNLASEENGLTPTLLAAHHGHLEALRILVGRGGDPEKTGAAGLNALHLAAGRNHLNCVSFLVNFGVNMWALDNDLRTAKDIAAIEQNKEVLEYLDQIMAKQSALNTKNVQKLKEKAKVATEKRLKQVRKAQLRAIKQVEKDERYLVKLSNNRRLLKAAHSISDIKLVGRSDQNQQRQISYSPSDRRSLTSSVYPLPSGSSSIISDPTSRLSSSPHMTNFINHKLHMDLLSQPPRQLKFRTSNLSSSTSNSTTDESAYSSSSVSSTSGYLSTSGSTSALSLLAKQQSSSQAAAATKESGGELRRPKYSDLVSVTNDQQLMANMRLRARLAKKQSSLNEQQSLKSNSTIGNKLRVIGGVSRKVQLKRLLLVNSLSANNVPLEQTLSADEQLGTERVQSPINEEEHSNSCKQEQSTNNNGKLCNVQSAFKLKMAGFDPGQRQQQHQQQQQQARSSGRILSSSGTQQVEQATANNSSIKWPPAPSMTRAVSEPDFSLALRCSATDEHVSECEHDQEDDTSVANETASAKPNQLAETPKQMPNMDETSAKESTSISMNRDESRHLLLTQCLSQLKLRHQAILKDQQSEVSEDLAESQEREQQQHSTKLINASGRPVLRAEQQASILYGTSDELLQHQLSAGEFPLRPSIIKQQQQQQQQQQHQQPLNLQPITISNQHRNSQQVNLSSSSSSSKSSAAISVDSIGSAGSLAQRNSASSSSSKSSSSTASSSLSYASSYTSSIEVAKMSQQNLSRLAAQKGASVALGNCCEEGQQQQQAPSMLDEDGAPATHSNPLTAGCEPISSETIDTFLLANGLIELSEVFHREKIDLEALMLLSEDDLKSLDILLGPRRKLLKAVAMRRQTSRESHSGQLGPMFVMVDTPL